MRVMINYKKKRLPTEIYTRGIYSVVLYSKNIYLNDSFGTPDVFIKIVLRLTFNKIYDIKFFRNIEYHDSIMSHSIAEDTLLLRDELVGMSFEFRAQ